MWSLAQHALQRLALRDNVTVGRNFHVGPNSILWAPRSLQVGNEVYVGKNVTIQVDGRIGDAVLIANNVGIVGRRDHDYSNIDSPVTSSPWVGQDAERLSAPVTVGSDIWIGFGAIILSGLTIGDSAIVAAGSVVTRDVAPNSIVSGNPARVIKQRFPEGELRTHWKALAASGVRLQERGN